MHKWVAGPLIKLLRMNQVWILSIKSIFTAGLGFFR